MIIWWSWRGKYFLLRGKLHFVEIVHYTEYLLGSNILL